MSDTTECDTALTAGGGTGQVHFLTHFGTSSSSCRTMSFAAAREAAAAGSESEDDSLAGRCIAAAKAGASGWDGDNMELEHLRESGRLLKDGKGLPLQGSQSSSAYAAVDLSKFRNTEVGQGYQAKHVIRQKTTGAPIDIVRDNSTSGKESGVDNRPSQPPYNERVNDPRTDIAAKREEAKDRFRGDGNRPKRNRDQGDTSSSRDLLSSPGLRLFRKELEKY
jgi:hypothetical protein